jgi:hypothetical protein
MVMLRRDLGDELHRAVKMALDTGEAATLEEAHALFRDYRLVVAVGPDVEHSATLQAAVLTIVNMARRCFLGGVEVSGPLAMPLGAPWRACKTLQEAVEDLGGVPTSAPNATDPLVMVGDATAPTNMREFAIRATFQGWAGGATPLVSGTRLDESQEFIPSGVLAGALSVSEAFQHVRGGNAAAGRRDIGLSLWHPEPTVSWLSPEAVGPVLQLLPTKLWLIGLGHLGQAFLWTIGFLPYANPAELLLVLQDFDTLVKANDSTSPLTHAGLLGQKKARAMAAWAEGRGFRTAISERKFAADFHVAPEEPAIALCGVDNPQARAVLEDVGFSRVVEAGLGKGPTEYLAFQVHGFPGPQRAREVWSAARTAAAESQSPALIRLPAYAGLAGVDGLDECGLITLAGRSVGAAFVGAAVSAIVIAEVLRELAGGASSGLIDGSLRSLAHRVVMPADRISASNPGFCFTDA